MRRREDREVLIRDHHDGYISWDQYERNQNTIASNANMKGAMGIGSVAQRRWAFAGRCGAGTADASRVLHNQCHGPICLQH
jgi:hypothetical protein